MDSESWARTFEMFLRPIEGNFEGDDEQASTLDAICNDDVNWTPNQYLMDLFMELDELVGEER